MGKITKKCWMVRREKTQVTARFCNVTIKAGSNVNNQFSFPVHLVSINA